MNEVVTRSLGEFGKHLAMRPQGRQVQEALDQVLRKVPPGGVLVVDFAGVEMMDYSFADEALGSIFSRMAARKFPDRYLVIAVRDDEVNEALLENVEVALQQREVAALVIPYDALDTIRAAVETTVSNRPGPGGKSAVQGSSHPDLQWRLIGRLPDHLVDTLRAVMDRGQVTVRELGDALDLDSVTACNNRIAKLHQLHLVRRKAAIVPEGGRLYCYAGVV